MHTYISLGSNLGNRKTYIKKAIKMISPKSVSSIIETEPVDMENSGKFLNAVAEVETSLSPYDLLKYLEDIEKKLGRTDKGNYKPRTIDLDILSYEDLTINTPELKIPHPKLKEREFLCKLLLELKRKKD